MSTRWNEQSFVLISRVSPARCVVSGNGVACRYRRRSAVRIRRNALAFGDGSAGTSRTPSPTKHYPKASVGRGPVPRRCLGREMRRPTGGRPTANLKHRRIRRRWCEALVCFRGEKLSARTVPTDMPPNYYNSSKRSPAYLQICARTSERSGKLTCFPLGC